MFKTDSNLKSADAELQQRACEYLALSRVASLDVLATVLEEMPPFPEKESSGKQITIIWGIPDFTIFICLQFRAVESAQEKAAGSSAGESGNQIRWYDE